MNWYEWDTEANFEAWHEVINAELGYPNAKTGTLRYAEAREIEGKWIAYINDIYADGLTLTNLRPPNKSFD